MERIRGNDISMIFQEPMTSLNPLYTCGKQIAEAVALHQGLSASATPGTAPSRCCAASTSPSPSGGRTPIRTSSRAACASAS